MSVLYVRGKDGKFTRIRTVNGDGVKTVNGVEPDENGNIDVSASVSAEHLILKDKVTETYNKLYVADGKLTMAKEE